MNRPDAILVHVHCFYSELVSELFQCVSAIRQAWPDRVDVFATLPEGRLDLAELVSGLDRDARILSVANRGYDVAPFFSVLRAISLDDYRYVIKLHTKRDIDVCWLNFCRFRGNEWRKELISFCSTQSSARKTLGALEKFPKLGMVASWRLFDPVGCGAGYNVEGARAIVRNLGFRSFGNTIVYGTMFAIRAELLRPAVNCVLPEHFQMIDKGTEHRQFGLAGDWEGAFGMLVNAQGYYVSDGAFGPTIDKMRIFLRSELFRALRTVSDFLRWQVSFARRIARIRFRE